MTDFLARQRPDGDFDLIDEATGAVAFPLSSDLIYLLMLESLDEAERQALRAQCESDEEREALAVGLAYVDERKPSRAVFGAGTRITVKFGDDKE